MMCYRFVSEDMTSDKDSSPWKIGEWRKCAGEISPCENGFHASKTPYDSLQNVYGSRWFVSEARGEIAKHNDKFAASEMRLLREIPKGVLQEFAILCAEKVLPIFEKKYPKDLRPRMAIEAAKKYSVESTEENRAVADAATHAADAAAFAATRAAYAAYAAYAADDATYATRAAYAAYAATHAADAATYATRAAYAAADAAARAATYAAEITWQKRTLSRLVREALKAK